MLAAHPRVAQAAVIAHTVPGAVEGVSDKQLVGYVVLDGQVMLAREPEREAELVEQWQRVWGGLYSGLTSEAGAPAVLGEDFGGWNSSYTGAPIPLEQMREWRAAAVDRIRGLRAGGGCWRSGSVPGCCLPSWPRTVSSIGARTFPRRRSRRCRRRWHAQPWGDRVRLRVQPADVADGLPQGHFDVVVLNSVIQYFPSAGYLLDVLARGDAVAGTGRGVVYRRRAEPVVAAGVHHRDGVRRPHR